MAGKYMRETLAKLKEDIAKNPGYEKAVMEMRQKLRPATIDEMLEQEYLCRFGNLWVTRNEIAVLIEWRLFDSDHQKYAVSGSIEEVQLVPDPKGGVDDFIVRERGNGSVDLKLDEGCSYHFTFRFIDKSIEAGDDPLRPERFQMITFLVGIPLSKEKREALDALKYPHKQLLREGENFLKVNDAYDVLLEQAMKIINAKEISSAEKAERIGSFKEKFEPLRKELE